jgi:hypothetical protein
MPTKSKHRKNHKQKVAARNLRISHEKRKTEKMQREFIMNLIKQEQEKGLFDNTTPLAQDGGLIIDGPMVDGLMMDGPMVDGPIIDDPVFDGPIIDGPMIQGSVVVTDDSENS